MQFAMAKFHEAEEVSKRSLFKFLDYCGKWQNVFFRRKALSS